MRDARVACTESGMTKASGSDAAVHPAPSGWSTLVKPPLAAPEDIVLYELHVRDFSANDPRVPEALRGTYKAFTLDNSYGMRHLRSLARSGLTHVHILPAFDFATIDEDRSAWQQPPCNLASFPPALQLLVEWSYGRP